MRAHEDLGGAHDETRGPQRREQLGDEMPDQLLSVLRIALAAEGELRLLLLAVGAHARHAAVAEYEVPVRQPGAVARLADAHGFEHAAEEQLLADHARGEHFGDLVGVRLDAAHIVVVRGADLGHQRSERPPKPRRGRLRLLRLRRRRRGPGAAPAGGAGALAARGLLLCEQHLDDCPHHRHLRRMEKAQRVLRWEAVRILLEETFAIVSHMAREVVDPEKSAARRELRSDQALVLRVPAQELRDEGQVGGPRHRHLLVEDVQHSSATVQKGDAIAVVRVAHILLQRDALARAVVQLLPEDVVVELHLQMLVRQVDQQLLEGVAIEAFEAADVQDAEQAVLRRLRGTIVDAFSYGALCRSSDRSRAFRIGAELRVHAADQPLEEVLVQHPA
mmetsp:Transcript_55154/g.159683  ORF Transcript_55154/g.159683 Transcript_55154/m.159683 type:complete len:391 (-) Transcript_55154:1148-2320(-)